MIAILAAIALSAQPAPVAVGDTAWVFATVGHSEWCPAGHVRLDLKSGRYSITPTASRQVCGEVELERPVINGKLSDDALAPLQKAYLRATSEGLEDPTCRRGGLGEIIISNGGRPTLLAVDGRAVRTAPSDRNCWNRAAVDLHWLLDKTFRGYHRR